MRLDFPHPYTALQLRAQRILRAAARYVPPQNLATPPTFFGPAVGIYTASVSAAGSGYTNNDLVTIAGGTLASGGSAATARLTVSGGVVTGVAMTGNGQYATVPSSPASVTGGTGSGLTLSVQTGSMIQARNGATPTVTPSAGGSGYAFGDVIVANGTSPATRPPRYYVNATGGGGAATQLVLMDCGDATVSPGATTSTTAVTGAGTGCIVPVSASVPLPQAFHTGGPIIHPLDPRLQQMSGLWAWDQNFNTSIIGAYISKNLNSTSVFGNTAGQTNGHGVRFGTDSRRVEVFQSSSAAGMQVYVTDMATGVRFRARTSDYTVSGSTQGYLFDFGSRASRIVEIYFGPAAFIKGFNIDFPTATLWRVGFPDEIRAVAIGDSTSEGQGATNPVRASFVYTLGEMLGAPGIISNGIGGSGVTHGANSTNGFNYRVAAGNIDVGFIGEMDFVMVRTSSNNDNIYSDASVQAGVQDLIQQVAGKQPKAFLFCIPPQTPPGGGPNASRYAAIKAGFAAAKAALGNDPRILYIDNSATGPDGAWQTGTGNDASPTGDGNSDFYASTVSLAHPNDAGYVDMGRKAARAIIRELTKVSGLPTPLA